MNSARETGARLSPNAVDVFNADLGKATGDEIFSPSFFASDPVERLKCGSSWNFSAETSRGLDNQITPDEFVWALCVLTRVDPMHTDAKITTLTGLEPPLPSKSGSHNLLFQTALLGLFICIDLTL